MKKSIIPVTKGHPILTRQSLTPVKASSVSADPLGFLCFFLGEQEYGIDLNLIAQIVKPPPLTWLPRMDPFILGVISIRGAVVTLVDLRQLVDLDPTPWPRSSRVVVVEIEDEQIGLLVDRITKVRRMKDSDLERDLSLREGQRSDHVLFVARPEPNDLVVIIDLDAILEERLR